MDVSMELLRRRIGLSGLPVSGWQSRSRGSGVRWYLNKIIIGGTEFNRRLAASQQHLPSTSDSSIVLMNSFEQGTSSHSHKIVLRIPANPQMSWFWPPITNHLADSDARSLSCERALYWLEGAGFSETRASSTVHIWGVAMPRTIHQRQWRRARDVHRAIFLLPMERCDQNVQNELGR